MFGRLLKMPVVLEIVFLATFGIVSTSFGQKGGVDDPIFSRCSKVSKYLESAYSCRPDEFQRQVSCEDNQLEIRCPRMRHIAVHSASYGWSDRLIADCPSTGTVETGCPRTCATQFVVDQCQGKRRCVLDESIVGALTIAAAQQSCRRPQSVKYLGVIYTCVKKSSLRHIESSEEGFINPCDEDDGNEQKQQQGVSVRPTVSQFQHDRTPPLQPAGPSKTLSSDSTVSIRNWNVEAGNVDSETFLRTQFRDHRSYSTVAKSSSTLNKGHGHSTPSTFSGRSLREGLVQSSPGNRNERTRQQDGVAPDQVKQVSSGDASSIWIFTITDWLWTWKFVRDNTEKFVLYMLLGLSLGTIAILITILFYMVLCPRRGSRCKEVITSAHTAQQGTCSSPTWRMPESESSTGDDRTLHEDDVELTSFNHIDSLQRRTTYHPCATVGRPPSAIGRQSPPPAVAIATTTATINRSYSQANPPVVTRCFTPSPPTMTLPIPTTSAANGGFGVQMGNGRMVAMTPLSQGHCVGSLGRTCPGYLQRRDSYQLDPAPGCRTLQPMQHYYG